MTKLDIVICTYNRARDLEACLEALACGLPVVATAAQGISDIFPHGEADGGLVVPTGDTGAMRTALARILFEPDLRERLARRARHRVGEFASLDAVGTQLAAFLAGQSQALHPR